MEGPVWRGSGSKTAAESGRAPEVRANRTPPRQFRIVAAALVSRTACRKMPCACPLAPAPGSAPMKSPP